jgi:6,7-dimethyl-8-ribityllumazine synthase
MQMGTTKKRIVIIAAEFNKHIVDVMVAHAEKEMGKFDVELLTIIRVPGCYEVPLIADVQLSRANVDAVVVLGHIERGETLHGEVMGHVVHRSLVELELKHQKPIGIGIIGPGATVEQAEQRKAGSAIAAVRAAVRLLDILAAK